MQLQCSHHFRKMLISSILFCIFSLSFFVNESDAIPEYIQKGFRNVPEQLVISEFATMKSLKDSIYLNQDFDIDLFAQQLFNPKQLFMYLEDIIYPNASQCLRQLAAYVPPKLFNVTTDMWYINMIDSFGKPGDSILVGNVGWLGSKTICESIEVTNFQTVSYDVVSFKGRYVRTIVNFGDTIAKVLNIKNSTLEKLGALWGTCLPEACDNAKEIIPILNLVINSLALAYLHIDFNKKGIQVLNAEASYAYKYEDEFKYAGTFIAAVVISCFFLLLVVVATAYDYALARFPSNDELLDGGGPTQPKRHLQVEEYTPLLNSQQESNIRFTLPRPGLAGKLLLSFSLYTNLRKLMDTTDRPDSLNSIHGIRFISMTWVILTHTYYFALIFRIFDNSVELYPIVKRWSFQVIINASYSVDTFFLLSGLLMMYLFMKERDRSEEGMTPFKWVMFYVHRYLRLTPAYLLILMCYNWITPYVANGPIWPQNEQMDPNCKYWWTNVLYLNNIIHEDKMCMGWSWYLANDMQFHWFSPLILIPFMFHWIFGTAVLLCFMLGTMLATGLIVAHYAFQPVRNLDTPVSAQGDWFTDVYVKPWCRLGPYLIGMAYGYLIYATKRRPKINWPIALCGWAVAAVCCLAVQFGLHGYYGGDEVDQWALNLYNTVSRTVWAVGIGWVVFACSCGYGGFVDNILSWKPIIPFSRLTYCAYLVHPVAMYCLYLSMQKPLRYTDYFITNLYFCNLVMSYIWALIFSMLFEAPFIGLERTLLRKQ